MSFTIFFYIILIGDYMKQYEISNDGKVIGKVNIFSKNIDKELTNSLIESKDDTNFIKKTMGKQIYEIEYVVSDIDEIYDIVSKYIYDQDRIFEKVDEIKQYNNIKGIKKDTVIKLLVNEYELLKLNKLFNNLELNSVIKSKVYFIKNTCNENMLINKLNNIINNYNEYKNNSEYEFLTEEEKEKELNIFIRELDILIEEIEKNTNYKYGEDYIIPIKISNNKY